MKNADLLASFNKYCAEHPEQRFWQALRNWCGHAFVLVTDVPRWYEYMGASLYTDTFYWKDSNDMSV